jgi:hypothetical protein
VRPSYLSDCLQVMKSLLCNQLLPAWQCGKQARWALATQATALQLCVDKSCTAEEFPGTRRNLGSSFTGFFALLLLPPRRAKARCNNNMRGSYRLACLLP